MFTRWILLDIVELRGGGGGQGVRSFRAFIRIPVLHYHAKHVRAVI